MQNLEPDLQLTLLLLLFFQAFTGSLSLLGEMASLQQWPPELLPARQPRLLPCSHLYPTLLPKLTSFSSLNGPCGFSAPGICTCHFSSLETPSSFLFCLADTCCPKSQIKHLPLLGPSPQTTSCPCCISLITTHGTPLSFLVSCGHLPQDFSFTHYCSPST